MSTPINMMNFSEKTRYRALRELMKIRSYDNKSALVNDCGNGQTATVNLINKFDLWPELSKIKVTEASDLAVMDGMWRIPNREFKQNLYSRNS